MSQRFLGRPCTFGDDRHLTNLVLVEGHHVVYDKHAVAYTYVPENLRGYIKQQVRWNKSFYREMLWTLKSVHKHNAYLIYDLLMQLALPFMLLFALGYTVAKSVQGLRLPLLLPDHGHRHRLLVRVIRASQDEG